MGGKTQMKETMYVFKVDSQYRITIPAMARKLYCFEKDVYFKLQVIIFKFLAKKLIFIIQHQKLILKEDVLFQKKQEINLILSVMSCLIHLKMKLIVITDPYFLEKF